MSSVMGQKISVLDPIKFNVWHVLIIMHQNAPLTNGYTEC